MKLTIDTKEDSHEDIRKVIKMLQHLVGEFAVEDKPRNIFDDPSSFGAAAKDETQSGGIMGMFDSPSAVVQQEEKVIKEEKEDIPQIIPY